MYIIRGQFVGVNKPFRLNAYRYHFAEVLFIRAVTRRYACRKIMSVELRERPPARMQIYKEADVNLYTLPGLTKDEGEVAAPQLALLIESLHEGVKCQKSTALLMECVI